MRRASVTFVTGISTGPALGIPLPGSFLFLPIGSGQCDDLIPWMERLAEEAEPRAGIAYDGQPMMFVTASVTKKRHERACFLLAVFAKEGPPHAVPIGGNNARFSMIARSRLRCWVSPLPGPTARFCRCPGTRWLF